jgi:hypothetical protein
MPTGLSGSIVLHSVFLLSGANLLQTMAEREHKAAVRLGVRTDAGRDFF